MSRFRCCACDVPLTAEQLRIEVGICPSCRAEHDAAYVANLAAERLNLLNTLRWVLYWKIVAQEMAAMGWFMPTWLYTEGEN